LIGTMPHNEHRTPCDSNQQSALNTNTRKTPIPNPNKATDASKQNSYRPALKTNLTNSDQNNNTSRNNMTHLFDAHRGLVQPPSHPKHRIALFFLSSPTLSSPGIRSSSTSSHESRSTRRSIQAGRIRRAARGREKSRRGVRGRRRVQRRRRQSRRRLHFWILVKIVSLELPRSQEVVALPAQTTRELSICLANNGRRLSTRAAGKLSGKGSHSQVFVAFPIIVALHHLLGIRCLDIERDILHQPCSAQPILLLNNRRTVNKAYMWVYVLTLEHGKYYVGSTQNVAKRFQQHVAGHEDAASWTRLYKPKGVMSKQEFGSGKDARDEELRQTLVLCNRFGLDHVRGADYCTVSPTYERRKAQCGAIAYHLALDYEEVKQRLLEPVDTYFSRIHGSPQRKVSPGIIREATTTATTTTISVQGLKVACITNGDEDLLDPAPIVDKSAKKRPISSLLSCSHSERPPGKCSAQRESDNALLDASHEKTRRLEVSDSMLTCFRCGRLGHAVLNCV